MKMIKYCYCKTRPLKIPSVCGGDAPEQEAGLVEPLHTKCCHTWKSCFDMNITPIWIQSKNSLPPFRTLCLLVSPSFQIFVLRIRTNTRDLQTLVDANAALSERNGSGILDWAVSSRPGPAGCHFPATHLNCFTYMYIFIQLMPVQCIILPTRKINTQFFFF